MLFKLCGFDSKNGKFVKFQSVTNNYSLRQTDYIHKNFLEGTDNNRGYQRDK